VSPRAAPGAYADAALRQRQQREAEAAWRSGTVQPFIITQALDARNLYGPGVDHACGVREPAVDHWEAGTLYPTLAQLRALAVLTGYPLLFFTTAHEPVAFEDTTMRFHLRKRDRPPPPPVRCFLPEAIHAATGTRRCPHCRAEYRPGVPTVLRCPLCRSEQAGRTRIEDGIGCCPDCGGTWLAGGS
jgi:hypothetical protein